ncbi:MAG: hypothetical protein IJX64_04035 [Clostridia bacterium]|nr:hypothetical protein [Clostridia bacterium]
MCKMKSAIILKDRVFIPDYDSHTDMLAELKIEDTRENAERLFVRAELSPSDGDVFSPIDTWVFNVDQDIRPDWFVEEVEKGRMIEAVKAWAKGRIHIGVDGLKIDSGAGHYIKDCKNVVIYDNAKVEYICGSATVENIYGSATVKDICGNATVKYICDNATVKNISDNATVKGIHDNAKVEYIYGNATVKGICGNAKVEYIYGNAKVEYICGSATVENIYGSATVKDIYGSATVKYIYGNATVENIYGNATVENIYGSATVEDICDGATVIGSPYGWKNKDKFVLSDNATFKDRKAKIIYQAGDWELRLAESGKNSCT